MQYCPKCGGEIKGTVNYCPYCGAAQSTHDMPSMQYSYQARQPQTPSTTEQNNINQVQQNTNQMQSNSNDKLGLGYLLALIFTITLQPIGFIMSLIGYFTAKNRNNHTNKTLAKAGIIISIIEFIVLVLVSLICLLS